MTLFDKLCKAAQWLILLLATSLTFPTTAQASMLDECRALSTNPEDIQVCMDNFLDALDDNMNDLELMVLEELGGQNGETSAASDAFQRSQATFRDFQRENCLWYLEFSQPQDVAEQIAKDCLAEMSQARVVELQSLMTDQPARRDVAGYYVYGVDRNTLQLCGSGKRYWVEGDSTIVSQLQQDYLNQSVSDLAVLYIVVQGQVDESVDTPYPGHDGVFLLTGISEIRPPADGDCQLPTTNNAFDLASSTVESPLALEETEELAEDDEPQEEPEQQLKAYFGAWLAECEQLGDSYGCVVSSSLKGNDPEGDELSEELRPLIKLTRRSRKRTIVDLEFPKQEIDSVDKIIWSVDKFEIGAIDGSRIRVDEVSARQEIRDRNLIQETILPLLADGNDVIIDIDDDATSARYTGTLIGLTRALSFSDDFTASDGRL